MEHDQSCTGHTCTSRKEGLNPPPGSRRALDDLQWSVYPEGEEYFNLSLMARTLDNALTLRSDFMVRTVCGSCTEGVLLLSVYSTLCMTAITK